MMTQLKKKVLSKFAHGGSSALICLAFQRTHTENTPRRGNGRINRNHDDDKLHPENVLVDAPGENEANDDDDDDDARVFIFEKCATQKASFGGAARKKSALRVHLFFNERTTRGGGFDVELSFFVFFV